MNDNNTIWTVTLEEDSETKDLMLPLPPDLLDCLDWNIGDTLVWNYDNNDCLTLSKKTDIRVR